VFDTARVEDYVVCPGSLGGTGRKDTVFGNRETTNRHLATLACATVFACLPSPTVGAQPREPLPTAKQVVSRYVNAIGGEEVLRRQTGRAFTGAMTFPGNPVPAPFAEYAAPPSSYRLIVDIPEAGAYEEGVTNGIGWSVDPRGGATLLEGTRLGVILLRADFYAELDYSKNYRSMRVVEKTTYNDRPAYRLELETMFGTVIDEFFDTETGLLLGSTTKEPLPNGRTLTIRMLLDDYKEYGGRLFPLRTTLKTAGGEQVVVIRSVEIGSVKPSEFDPPPDVQVLIDARTGKK
jgi:hypothetical protein